MAVLLLLAVLAGATCHQAPLLGASALENSVPEGKKSWEESAERAGFHGQKHWRAVSHEPQSSGEKSQDEPGVEAASHQELQQSGVKSQDVPGVRSGEDWALGAGLRVVAAAYRQCRSGDNMLACLQLRALKAADRALKTDRIPLLDGVELVNTGEARALEAPAVDEERLLREPSRLTSLLLDRAAMFFNTHSVRMDLPRFLEMDVVSENDVGQGRKKKKKMMGGLLMMAGMMKAGMLALGMKAVALLAGKALLVAKVALVLAAVLGLGKLLGGGGGGGGGGHTTYEVVKHPHVSYGHSSSHEIHGGGGGGGGDYYETGGGGGGGGGYYETGGGGGGGHHGRSLAGGDPHSLAYRAHDVSAQLS